ncbi:hypothetical protein LAZ67_13000776 [Cordylochernes scorpioides]|uniref:Reverse transcriptase domain-containing protein n=1 Tax=Cordylochernes scorpioides TaxID=51811 RepID=A0ABY6L399_9ARAC|nr:hypothetical protein LAZ67_13000776 [Cordylochernes scorpioides]
MTEDSNMQKMTEAGDEYFADALTNMPPHCEDLVSRLTDAIRGIAVPRVEEALISPFDGSYAASNFIKQLERTSEGPQDDATLQTRLRTLLKDQREIQEQVEKMLEYDIIEPSFSPYSSPVTLVTKRDKTKRFCVDYRRLNEIIFPDVHHLPLIENILDKLANDKIYSRADFSSAYWSIEISPPDRNLLSFVTLEASRAAYQRSERETIREIVREWQDNGIVTETRSPYASPVLLVRKKTGDHRLVVYYRRLNIQTVKDKFPLPRIDKLLEGLRNAKFFTTLDLAHGYLQIPLTEKAKLKTTFITPDDTGQFERMIFGLANAPAEFQRLMHTVLGPLLNKKAFCYLDDVIIPAKDWREMIERLREVLERIRSAKLTLKPFKCEFGRREVEFLGYVISTGGLKPGPRKIKAIEEFPEPNNVHDIRRFLGLKNISRRIVKDFARKAEPLSRLTNKGTQFEWKEEQRRSFGGLRNDLVEYPVLAHYNPELRQKYIAMRVLRD